MSDEKTWMPLVAGICAIVSGALKILGSIGLITFLAFMKARPHFSIGIYESAILTGIMIPLIILGVVALAGGIYAIRRRLWGMALAGAIAAFLPSSVLGILAIIFVALSKNEFK